MLICRENGNRIYLDLVGFVGLGSMDCNNHWRRKRECLVRGKEEQKQSLLERGG